MNRTRLATVALGTVAALGTATFAQADTFYNDLDGSIDSTLETMTLTYDSLNSIGSTGSTVLRLRLDGPAQGDRGGCNVQGAPQYVTVEAHSTNESIVQLTNGPTYTFNLCSDWFTVGVVATGLDDGDGDGIGEADILFEVTDWQSSGGGNVTFPSAPADFTVVVNEGGGGGSTGCDADPAAPAWAAAILQKSGMKPGAKQTTNLISKIAGEMTQHADFAGIQKSAHPYYEDAVQDRLEVLTGKTLASAQAAARPGWVCTPIS